MLRTAVALAALACAGSAIAQTSNCTNIGGGMVHCDKMGRNGSMSSTDCTSIGGGMATCNTMGTGAGSGQPRAGGSTTLGVIADLMAQSRERSFQKKVGQMMAAGDCAGAANFAITKGRADLGLQIRQTCAAAPGAVAEKGLEDRLRLAVAKVTPMLPMALDDATTITKAEAIGTQILLTAAVSKAGTTMTDPLRAQVQNQICANWYPALLKAGASMRIVYVEPSGRQIGSIMVTRAECGL